jgi:flavin prenyltransferase
VKRIVVGISGSSGAVYGVRLVEVLATLPDVETHLIISGAARATIEFETSFTASRVEELADRVYEEREVGAGPASGTFLTAGMVVAPCSMKTLSAVANGYGDTLLTRAADVTMKERRTLVLVVRETPLHLGHIRLMARATESGAVILPPVPGFYIRPTTIDELVDHTITKILDQFEIDASLISRWEGLPPPHA